MLLHKLPLFKVNLSGWYSCACPFCSKDYKHYKHRHLHIAPDLSYAHCFRCGWKGTFIEVFEAWNIPITQPITPTQQPTIQNKITINNIIPFYYNKKAYNYIKQRNSEKFAFIYKWKYCIKGKLGGRIIIPCKNIFNERFFVCRSIFNNPIKYLHVGNKSRFLYPYSFRFKYKTIFLVEGVFDAVAVFNCGYIGLSMFGKILSKTQIELIELLKPCKVFLLLDSPQKDRFIKQAIDRNIKLYRKLEPIIIDYGDPANYKDLKNILKSII